MEETALDTVCCSMCSLTIRVFYQQMGEQVEGQEEAEGDKEEWI